MLYEHKLLLLEPPRAVASSPAFEFDDTDVILRMRASEGLFQTSGGASAVANGDKVGQWQDQTGNGWHANQVTSTKRMNLATNAQNGRQLIYGDGVDDYLVTADIAHNISTGDYWWLVAAKMGDISLMANGAYNPVFYTQAGEIRVYQSGDYDFTTDVVIGDFYILELEKASGVMKCHINGVLDASTFAHPFGMPNSSIQIAENHPAGGQGALAGSHQFGEIIFKNGLPDPTYRAELLTYLGEYYGITVTP